MPFDLAALDTKASAEKGIVVELENPAKSGEPLTDADGQPVTITILGGDSEKVRAKSRKTLDKHFKAIRKGKDLGGAEESEQEMIDKLAAATIAWSGFVIDGKPLDCTEHNARKLYADPRFPWIVEQLQRVIDDRARFFGQSSTS